MDPQEFHQRCSTMNTLLDEADRKFRAWLSGISIAYSDAWERHNSKTKEIEDSLKEDFALDAALLFLGGIGSHIAKGAIKRAMKLGKDDDSPILSGLTKLSDKGVEWGLGKAKLSRKLPTFPTSPFRWKNTISARVDSELGIVTEKVRRWQEAIDNKDPNFKTDFDPHQAVKDALAVPIDPSGLGTALAAILKGPADMLTALGKTELLRRPSEGLLKQISKKLKIDVVKVASNLSQTQSISVLNLEAVNTAELQKDFERGFLAYWLLETAPFGSSMGSMQAYQPPEVRAVYYSSGPLLPSTDFEDVISYGQSLGLTKEATQLLIFAGMDKWKKK